MMRIRTPNTNIDVQMGELFSCAMHSVVISVHRGPIEQSTFMSQVATRLQEILSELVSAKQTYGDMLSSSTTSVQDVVNACPRFMGMIIESQYRDTNIILLKDDSIIGDSFVMSASHRIESETVRNFISMLLRELDTRIHELALDIQFLEEKCKAG